MPKKSPRDTDTRDQEIGEGVEIVGTHPNIKILKNNARQNTLHPSPPAELASGTFIKQTLPLPLLEKGGRSIRAQEGESCLIFRDEDLVCIGEHRTDPVQV